MYYQEMYLETQSKVYGGVFFANIVNRHWAMSEVYLENSEKSMVEHFCENSSQLLAVNYFCKKAPS